MLEKKQESNAIKGFPPNIDKIKQVLKLPERGVVFTYGGKIYSQETDNLPLHLIIHENVHIKQQGEDSDLWWDKYLTDRKFRLLQEVEAYAVQYNFVKQVLVNKISKEFLFEISEHLSAPMYDLEITRPQAETLIRIKSKDILNETKTK